MRRQRASLQSYSEGATTAIRALLSSSSRHRGHQELLLALLFPVQLICFLPYVPAPPPPDYTQSTRQRPPRVSLMTHSLV